MNALPAKISLHDWDLRYEQMCQARIDLGPNAGPLGRHLDDGDYRLRSLLFDNSPAAIRLWNFLLTEEDRLRASRRQGKKIIGTMKDLGTASVLAYAFDNLVAFYPDGAWWTPCIMQMSDKLFEIADSHGVNESFCPVRAMLGAFISQDRFPIPDLLVCSAGAICDDFSAIAQHVNGLGLPILWWEIPYRQTMAASAINTQVQFIKIELRRIQSAFEELTSQTLTDADVAQSIKNANVIRHKLKELRHLAFTASLCPMPALEMLIAEMLAIHFCSDPVECLAVLDHLLIEVHRRIAASIGHLTTDAARIFWINPVADLRMMNVLESCNGRICGTDYLFTHALDLIPEDIEPLEALARMAISDPMIGPADHRADRICRDIELFGAEALVISRIPGASHCASEGAIIAEIVHNRLNIPTVEIEVPPLSDAVLPSITNRIEALIETVMLRRKKCFA